MTFLAPIGLIALLTLPLILLLHLIGERRRRQIVPSLMLWQGIPVRPDGARWKMLPISLLLLLHLLAATLIGLALARPQIAGLPSDGARHTAVLIDTSTSMGASEGAQTRLDLAKARARALIAEMRPGDRMTIMSVGTRAQILSEGGAADAPLLNAALDRLRAGGVGVDLHGAIALAEASLDREHTRRIVAFSDGAIAPVEPRRVSVPFEWSVVGSAQPNRAIVTFAARPWGGKLQVYARIANYDARQFSTTLRLYGDGQLIGSDIVPLSPNGEYELTWSLPTAYVELRAELDTADALAADDQAFLSVQSVRPISALLVSSRPDPLVRALSAVPGVSITTLTPQDYLARPGGAADLTVLDGVLPAAWPEGAILVINPPPDSPLLTVGGTPQAISSTNLVRNGELLDGLGFSGVRFGDVYALDPPPWATPLLASRSDALDDTGAVIRVETPLVLRGQVDGREIAIWNFDLLRGNLPSRLAFPLLTVRTVRDLTATVPPSAITLGAQVALRPDLRTESVTLIAPDGSSDLMAPRAAGALASLTQPGFYQIEERVGARVIYQASIGVNAGSPGESRLDPQAPPPISGAEQDAGAAGPLTQPVDLWPWLAAAGLLVLAGEWLYVVLRR